MDENENGVVNVNVSSTSTDGSLVVGVVVGLLVTAVVALVLAGGLVVKADAAQPYGGCDEAWRYPHSQGAAECRRAGWTIRPHFTIDPTNRLRSTDLPACRYEDSHGCYWNARKRGNGRGDSFVTTMRGRVYYVAFR